jgi:transcriptional regulator with PAS, ATPase and Fis domain
VAPLLPIFQDYSLLKQKATQLVFSCFDELAEGCLIVDQDVRVVMISDRYAANLGVKPADVIGQEIETFLPNSLMRQVVVTGKPILLEIFEAQEHALVVSRMPIRDEDGTVVGAMAFALYSDLEPLKPFIDRFSQLQAELAHAHKKLDEARRSKYTFSSFLGNSPGTMETKRLARRAALVHAPVLLRGETGTGKELLAHAIHAGGPRAERPFVTVNVAAIPETLLEAEFFGVAPGAYTGADRKHRPGKFEVADGGTLFLDEIGDMPIALQAKLLRVLQDQEVEPLGSNRIIRVDVRIMAATSCDLEAMVKNGSFRKDLFYRLNVLTIPLPRAEPRGHGPPGAPSLARQRAGTGERPGTGHARHRFAYPGSVRFHGTGGGQGGAGPGPARRLSGHDARGGLGRHRTPGPRRGPGSLSWQHDRGGAPPRHRPDHAVPEVDGAPPAHLN